MAKKAKGQTARERVEAALDEALQETFPASDPLEMTEPAAERAAAAGPPSRRGASGASAARPRRRPAAR
jgi:hypothetical protein